MSVIFTDRGSSYRIGYANEADLESAIIRVQSELFGAKRIYLPVKKRIGAKDGIKNIPDGYLIDLSGSQPRLYVVENELAAHDPFRHIAVQILQFSLSFKSEGRGVKTILFDALAEQPDLRKQGEEYAAARGFRNLDHLLDAVVFDAPFTALVIIDDLPGNLRTLLAEELHFRVEMIELMRYQNEVGDKIYRFTAFPACESHENGKPPAEAHENRPMGYDVFTELLENPIKRDDLISAMTQAKFSPATASAYITWSKRVIDDNHMNPFYFEVESYKDANGVVWLRKKPGRDFRHEEGGNPVSEWIGKWPEISSGYAARFF